MKCTYCHKDLPPEAKSVDWGWASGRFKFCGYACQRWHSYHKCVSMKMSRWAKEEKSIDVINKLRAEFDIKNKPKSPDPMAEKKAQILAEKEQTETVKIIPASEQNEAVVSVKELMEDKVDKVVIIPSREQTETIEEVVTVEQIVKEPEQEAKPTRRKPLRKLCVDYEGQFFDWRVFIGGEADMTKHGELHGSLYEGIGIEDVEDMIDELKDILQAMKEMNT